MMDAARIKNILNETITTVVSEGSTGIVENEELSFLLAELSDESTTDRIILTTENGRRFAVAVSVVELPSG